MESQLNRFFIFIATFTTILSAGYIYIGLRLIQNLNLGAISQVVFWFVIAGFVLMTPISYVLNLFYKDSPFQTSLAYIAFASLGFFMILFSLIFFKDILGILMKPFSFISIPDDSKIKTTTEFLFSRKEFFSRFGGISALAISVGLSSYGLYKARYGVTIQKVKIRKRHLHKNLENFRIVQLSDIHVGPTIKKEFIQELRDKVNQLKADLVVITGDLVDGRVDYLSEHVSPLKDIQSKHGIFFVTGNHEYYSGAFAWIKELDRLGIKTLTNNKITINHQNAKLNLGGIPDIAGAGVHPSHSPDISLACDAKGETDFSILLCHRPNHIHEAAKFGFDLQLSGHTHGGQFFPGNYLIHFFQKFVQGLHKIENTWLYVNRGTGYWGPPIRVGTSPEITLFELEGQA